jgi:disulfide bond formation protein DsbB
MKKFASNPRLPFAAVAAVSLLLVAAGVVLTQLLNLAACPLCILQRMIYLLLAAVGVVGLLVSRPLPRRLAAVAMAAVAGCGAFVAAYQVWIQNFARETNCVAAAPWWEQLVDWASERVPLLFQVSGLCSEPGWKLFGVTIAEWSLLAFLSLCAVSLFAAFRGR